MAIVHLKSWDFAVDLLGELVFHRKAEAQRFTGDIWLV
jgi:hypothetical protein